jgi:hypothetical protein
MRRLLLIVALVALSLTWRPLPLLAQSQAPWTDEELANGVRREDIVRYAFSGQQMNLAFLYAVEMDCSVIDGWEYEIIKQPEHGIAEIRPHTGFTFFPKGNPRAKCNEQKIDGQMLIYRAEKGYKGPDSFTYLTINPAGFAVERTYRFNVRALPATHARAKQKDA